LKWMAEATGSPSKQNNEEATAQCPALGHGEAAEGYRGTRHLNLCMDVPVKPRRRLRCLLSANFFPTTLRFLFLRETPMAFSCDYFKKLNG